ncbi:hypothetical protein BJ912DRAFT_1046575 [Pholiota molesta]|nr:hypothetical protein BJ912DRAFT_1046575 [Pholiota molesta]
MTTKGIRGWKTMAGGPRARPNRDCPPPQGPPVNVGLVGTTSPTSAPLDDDDNAHCGQEKRKHPAGARLHPKPGDAERGEPSFGKKVQQPVVGTHMHWVFDLFVYFAVDFVAEDLRQELDFVREADNARRTNSFVPAEPYLRHRVYIPKVYPEYSTRIRAAERQVERPGQVKDVMQMMVELFGPTIPSTCAKGTACIAISAARRRAGGVLG